MTQKHTLTVRQVCDVVYIIDENEHEVANMAVKSDYKRAHLFAAALDLLEALKSAIPYMEAAQEKAAYTVKPLVEARAAIAKAEGR